MTAQQSRIGSTLVLAAVLVVLGGLGFWKYGSINQAQAASAMGAEPMELVTTAVAAVRPHRETATAVGTVLALRSITLRNEVPGTVSQVRLAPGQIVEAGSILVALDVSVEESELNAQEAQAALAQTVLDRVQRLMDERAAPQSELDRALAERNVALAQVARTKAIIQRKIIRAPFRARVGIADVHPGQYLEQGAVLTTLQGVSDAAHIDFAVAQHVAATLRPGADVRVAASERAAPIAARIVAVDSRVDPTTRNAMVRAEIRGGSQALVPGASVRVIVPFGPPIDGVAVPVSALRKGPSGDHVFVVAADSAGKSRAHVRPVKTGPVLGDSVLILEGLKAGEQVAASGSFKLRDAMLVAAANETTSH